ncbi:MAG: HIT domain-containing protein [Proteobacteria bacterium]|nr:HIT domain-containing protein [Pseudomonadota bacterium]
MTCIFWHIVAHELPAEILCEDNDLVIFKDINPAAPIHFLIVPKKHIDSINGLDEKNAGIVSKMVLAAKRMAEQHGVQSGYRLMINTGREAGQVVYHLHMHFMGGWGRKPVIR